MPRRARHTPSASPRPIVDRESVLGFFRDNPRPLSMREVANRMGLSSAGLRSLKRTMRELVQDGQILRTKRGLYGPTEEMELLTGYFEAHRDGYGFVIPEAPGERDVFIPPRHTMHAMEGDRVSVSVLSRRTRSGRVVRILERSVKRIAGTVDSSMGSCFVRPRSSSIPFDIHIPPKVRMGARDGQSVLVELDTYPSAKRPAVGRVVSIIEHPVDARSDAESIIEEFNLPRRFPSGISSDAKEVALRPATAGDRPPRRDLRGLNTVTIDGESAKDFDDAISIEKHARGFTLWVHIADVGHYVDEGARLDLEARQRGTSVYFPGSVIPMLPKALSEDVCSLMPARERAAFTVEMALDAYGNIKETDFYKSLIKSDHRMTYTSMRMILVDREPGERKRYSSFIEDFELMGELASLMRTNRLARGSLDFDLPEPEVLLDIRGNPENIVSAERNIAHMMIEDFMIAANEAVASHLELKGAPCMYRIHEDPDPEKVAEVMRVAAMPIGRKKAAEPSAIKALVGRVKGTHLEEAVNYMVLRSMKQARYSDENMGHFGLASESYCHFTSPIRRYPDLVVHRILAESVLSGGLREETRARYKETLGELAFHCSRRERLAMEAEREVVDAMRVWFMRDKVGEEFGAAIIGVTPKGIRIRLHDFFVVGFIQLSDMTDDYYIYDDDSLMLRGRNTKRALSFGLELTVRVDRVDLAERRITFAIL